jgi:hypothetical protein
VLDFLIIWLLLSIMLGAIWSALGLLFHHEDDP